MTTEATQPLLIDVLLPHIMSAFAASEPTILVNIGNPIVREALSLCWSTITPIVSNEIRGSYLAVMQRYGSMTVSDIAAQFAADLSVATSKPFAFAQIKVALDAADATLTARGE